MSMFSLKGETLGSITFDNSVKFIPRIEQTRETDNKPKTIKKNLLTRKQDKNF